MSTGTNGTKKDTIAGNEKILTVAKNKKNTMGFVCFFVMTLFLAILILSELSQIKQESNLDKEHPVFLGNQALMMKVNCDVEKILAMDDEQCSLLCAPPGIYREKNGLCVNMLIFDQTDIVDNCDPTKGVLAYLVGDPQLGRIKSRCLTIDLGIQPNDALEPNRFCTDGTIDINYIKSFPRFEDCNCPNGHVLTLIPSTSTIRSRAVCVPEGQASVYAHNNLIYKNDL